MAKNKYYVNFSLTLSVDRVIAADSEDEACRIAQDMLYEDDRFTDDLFESMDTDWDAWRPKYVEVCGCGKAPDDEVASN